jgi:hypothetical protein
MQGPNNTFVSLTSAFINEYNEFYSDYTKRRDQSDIFLSQNILGASKTTCSSSQSDFAYLNRLSPDHLQLKTDLESIQQAYTMLTATVSDLMIRFLKVAKESTTISFGR